MRVQLTKEYDGQPAGLQADWPDEKARAAVTAGAAVATSRVRFTKDYAHRGRTFPSRFEFDLLPDDAAKAVGDGAAEYADEGERARAEAKPGEQPAVEATAPEARRTRTPKAEGA